MFLLCGFRFHDIMEMFKFTNISSQFVFILWFF